MIEQPYTRIDNASYPLVPVTLTNTDGNAILPILALVDSGANISLFHADIAQLLGLDLTAGPKIPLTGIKDSLEAYVHLVQCQVGEYTCSCRIGFSAELTFEFQVLGRLDFFEKCKILFDEANQKFYITPHGT